MEGGTKMLSLPRSELAGPLSVALLRQCPQPDFLVGIVRRKDGQAMPGIINPLAQSLKVQVKDVCCMDWFPSGPGAFKTLTTHGNAKVDSESNEFPPRIDIFGASGSRAEHIIWQNLQHQRDALLTGMSHGAPQNDFAYATIQQGNVVLCGDFATVPPYIMAVLREIFLQNGAKRVIFVTPALVRANCEILDDAGFEIVRLHPPQCVAV